MHIKVNYFRRSVVEREQRELNVCGKFGWSPLPLLILSPLLAALIEPISVCVCVECLWSGQAYPKQTADVAETPLSLQRCLSRRYRRRRRLSLRRARPWP